MLQMIAGERVEWYYLLIIVCGGTMMLFYDGIKINSACNFVRKAILDGFADQITIIALDALSNQ